MVKRKNIPTFLTSLLKNKEESRYARMIYAAIILLFILSARLFYMQVVEGSYYKEEADGNRIRSIPVQATAESCMTGTESFWQVQGLHTASSCLLTGREIP